MIKVMKGFVCAMVLISLVSMSVRAAEKKQVVNIKTSAICGSCKNRIEKAVKAVDGVEEAQLNLNNKKIKIKYDPAKTDADKLRATIAATGYDADDVKKSEDAFDKLPMCCQKPMAGDKD